MVSSPSNFTTQSIICDACILTCVHILMDHLADAEFMVGKIVHDALKRREAQQPTGSESSIANETEVPGEAKT
jgi:hypothetical protein